MLIKYQQLITLLPILIIGLAVLVTLLLIAWRRNHFIIAIATTTSLCLAFVSLYFVAQYCPTNIVFLMHIDYFSILYSGQILFASIMITILAYNWLMGYNDNCEEFYLLLLIATIGGLLLTSASHMTTLFLGIELISLPLFGMTGYTFKQKYPLEASIKYTLLSAVASTFLLFGIGLLYVQTGLLSCYKLAQIFNTTMLVDPLFITGLGMIIVGLGFKLSLVPFHLWTPDVYQGAPVPVSAFLSTANKIAIIAVMMRIFLLYIPINHSITIKLIFTIISFSSILLGNLMALSQNDIKRILGCSSIVNFGYLLIELIPDNNISLATETVSIYLIGYLFANLSVFGIISLISNACKKEDASAIFIYRGLFWHHPLLASALTVTMLSLAGIPMTLGFIGKFYIMMFCIKNHLSWLTGIIVIGSAIGLFYYLRIVVILYLSPAKNTHYYIPHNWYITPIGMLIIISILVILSMGLYPQILINLVQFFNLQH